MNFAIEREQRLLAGYAEQERSQAPAGGLKVKGELCEYINPHPTSEPIRGGRTKSVSGGAGLFTNPRIGARSSVRPSVVGGDVCEESLTALRLFSSSLHGIIRWAASAHAASAGFAPLFAGTKSGNSQQLQAAFSKESSIFAPLKQLRPGVAECLYRLPPARPQIQQSPA